MSVGVRVRRRLLVVPPTQDLQKPLGVFMLIAPGGPTLSSLVQEEVMNKYDSCQDELIMFSYLCGTVFVAAFCLFTGDLQKGVLFLHHQVRRVSGRVNSSCGLLQGVGGVSRCEVAGAGLRQVGITLEDVFTRVTFVLSLALRGAGCKPALHVEGGAFVRASFRWQRRFVTCFLV